MPLATLNPIRFGAALTFRYNNTLSADTLDKAAQLVKAHESVKPRIAAIQDQLDPIGIQVTISNKETYAVLKTEKNGTQTIPMETAETPDVFIHKVVTESENLAKKLHSNPPQTRIASLLSGLALAGGATAAGTIAYSIFSNIPPAATNHLDTLLMLPFKFGYLSIGLAAGAGALVGGGAAMYDLVRACLPNQQASSNTDKAPNQPPPKS